MDITEKLTSEENDLVVAVIAARKVQEFLWGEQNKNWGIEEWRRMFKKRLVKIEEIDMNNPYALIELRKRLLQNAALSIALLRLIREQELKEGVGQLPSNLEQYEEKKNSKIDHPL